MTTTEEEKQNKILKFEIGEYKQLREEFRYHWEEGRIAAEKAGKDLNEMVSLIHKENPEWSISKIANKIWIDNEDLEGFSKNTIYRNLNDDNRTLLDGSKQNRNNVIEQSVPMWEHKDIEDSSITSGSDDTIDNKISTLPDEMKRGYTHENDVNIPTAYETKDAETKEEKDFDLSLLQTDFPSLQINDDPILLSFIKKWSYPSHKAKDLEMNTIIISPDPEHFCNPYTRLRYGGGIYGIKLHRYINMWIEMKKLYKEMIEFGLENYQSYNIDDVRSELESDFKAFKLELSDSISEYIHRYFIDRKTREYLQNKYKRVEYDNKKEYQEWHRQFERHDYNEDETESESKTEEMEDLR